MSITLLPGERYLPGAGLLHRLDARTKIISTLAFVLAVLLVPDAHWPAFAALALMLAAVVALATLSPLLVLRRSALALPFLLVAVPLLFTTDGDELFTIPLFSWRPFATDDGLAALGSVLARSWLSVCAAVILTATTPPLDLLRALRWLRVPRIIVATVLFMYRYLHLIGEEALRLMRARDSRSAHVGRGSGGRPAWQARVVGGMMGSLFLRSYERSERVFDAMTARGFDGEVLVLSRPSMALRDRLALVSFAALLLLIEMWARL